MALVWAEPFEQYGGSNATLSQSGYTGNTGINVNAAGRTGLKAANFNNAGWLIRALDNPGVTTLGQGVAFNSQAAQADNINNMGFISQDTGGGQFRVTQLGDLSFGVWDSTNTLVGRTPPNMVIVGSYVWVEGRFVKNSAGIGTGSAEVRVNGVQRLVVNGLNAPNGFANHQIGGFNFGNANYDDWIVWDNTGADNNTFMGDRRLFYSPPNANGATQNFIASAGSAFNCVNVLPPVDTTYIEGQNPGDISDFQKAAIGLNSTDVAALVIWGRLFKTDAGVASGRLGINSAANILNSPEIFPGTTGSYARFVIERDPNGNIHWTKAAADAAFVRATRVQ